MKLHANARTCPKSRELLAKRVIDENWTLIAAAEAAGVSVVSARKWVTRFRAGESLQDRSSRPRRSPARLPRDKVEAIEKLRRLRMTAAQIAEILELALSTVSLWLKRIGLGKRSRLEPFEPINRYERRHPGDLVHVDIKTLARISTKGAGHRMTGKRGQVRATVDGHRSSVTGWEYVHVMIDDYSRLAYAEVLQSLNSIAAVGFLKRATRWFSERGIEIRELMTDNGSAYVSHAHANACRELGLRHLRIRPRRPQTNGKAERFIQTLTNEWAYGRIYGSSAERTSMLEPWLTHYNLRRPHGSLGHKPPGSRVNNVLGNYS
ncbi:MAG TPA: IS481 family transposase [Gemmatimonadales bacterium]|nr:IS481 family transposase [Gemmatimonadales bacterium]